LDIAYRIDARANGGAVKMHRTRPALSEATPKTWAVQAEIISQEVQKRHRRIVYGCGDCQAIDVELKLRHLGSLVCT